MSYQEQAEKARKEGRTRNLKTEIVILENQGDSLVGKLLGRKTIPTKGKTATSTMYEFDTDFGRVGLLLGKYGQIPLDDDNNIGKTLIVTRGEKIKIPGKNEYVDYTVEVIE